ncbi:hypothetical protein VN12_11365 [Pirellula sp. SH-Sr6A]|uniref:hypothetical protein n=1 Tax=Pirellula sp. SH-Sr6A TaxID=1632865 RepID=UPI00078BF82B|nr:hypothetical protein [Pirellula sp. SH-Sr6A]AMV32714.1 hypothetical protein VN12_11365 [Pirellula sp. SH-Sr6A]
MSRRERFIPPTDEELRRLEEAHIEKQKLVESRKGLIAKTLRTQRKESLVQILTKVCDENIHARWIIEAELGMTKPVELLRHDLREAIQLATHVDEKHINYNFSFDWDAYAEVKRLMEMLVSLSAIPEAMEIAIHFMEKASRQIEYSNEGMMLEQVEAGLHPIFEALENHDETQRSEWALRLQTADRVGFVCHEKLKRWTNNPR